jgi:hypothetical protein
MAGWLELDLFNSARLIRISRRYVVVVKTEDPAN